MYADALEVTKNIIQDMSETFFCLNMENKISMQTIIIALYPEGV